MKEEGKFAVQNSIFLETKYLKIFQTQKKKDIKRRDTYLSEYFCVNKTVYSVECAYVAKCW